VRGFTRSCARLRKRYKPTLKVDLGLWAKNGASTLPMVLERIEEVIPAEFVGQKILVDDGSQDSTVDVAECFGWDVYPNPHGGVSSGANEVLRHVRTPFFASFEQDLYLSRSWWSYVSQFMEQPNVAIASGMRFADVPLALRKLQLYVAKKYRGEQYLSSWLRSRQMASFTLGKTLDNTFYRTDFMRMIGGFPDLGCNAGVDSVLAYLVRKHGYMWKVAYDVQSIHLRLSFSNELRHQYWYATQLPRIWSQIEKQCGEKPPITRSAIFSRLLLSPLTAMFVVLKTHEIMIFVAYPLIRLFYVWGLLNA